MSYCGTFSTLDLIPLDLIPLDLILEVISFISYSIRSYSNLPIRSYIIRSFPVSLPEVETGIRSDDGSQRGKLASCNENSSEHSFRYTADRESQEKEPYRRLDIGPWLAVIQKYSWGSLDLSPDSHRKPQFENVSNINWMSQIGGGARLAWKKPIMTDLVRYGINSDHHTTRKSLKERTVSFWFDWVNKALGSIC